MSKAAGNDKRAEPRKAAGPIGFVPQRRLTVVLGVIFGLWVVGLIVLYVTTVYPQRHGARARATTEPLEIEGAGK